jgi:hypothetical protein
MGYGLDGWRSIPGTGKRIFFSPQHPDLIWGPPSLISSGYWRLFPRGVKLTSDIFLVPRSRMVELYLHSPTHLHGMMIIIN